MKAVVFLVILVSLFFAFTSAAVEGVYEWNGWGNDTAYVCLEDGKLYGTFGYVGWFWAKPYGSDGQWVGKWIGVGYKFGGKRVAQNRNSPTLGSIYLKWNEDTGLSGYMYAKGSDTKLPFKIGAQTSETVDSRVWQCGILSSNESLAGSFAESADSPFFEDVSVNQCVHESEANLYDGSFAVPIDNETTIELYKQGKCSLGGRVCRADYFFDGGFGTLLDVILSDGRVLALEVRGPTARMVRDGVFPTVHLLERVGDAADTECALSSALWQNPFACRAFGDDEANCNSYYCKVSQTSGNCKRKPWSPKA